MRLRPANTRLPREARAVARAAAAVLCILCALGAGLQAAGQTAEELNTAGVRHYGEKNWPEAIACFEQACDLEPDNSTIRRNLCNAYHASAISMAKEGDFEGAEQQLLLAIGVDPENSRPLTCLGTCYLHMGLVPDAISRLEEAIALDPENIDAHYYLGQAYYDDNDLAAALAQWEYVQEVQPNRPGLPERLEKAYREELVEYDFHQTDSRHFRISYARGTDGGDLRKVLAACEKAYRDIGRKFGGVYPPTPVQVILYTADDFSKVTLLGEHVGAAYDGKIRVPIKDSSGTVLAEDELHRRLSHEYTHVVVAFWAGQNVPWWLNEGLAETFSKDGLSSTDSDLLRRAKTQNLLFALNDLEESQIASLDTDALWLAYVQSHATVRYMWSRFGLPALTGTLNALSEGVPAEDALVQHYRRNYERLQQEVANNIGQSAPR
ncbi:MAG: tetratricopeptide repeat protein [Candidatus Hydrogenedentes bacterium]|nr:tetratricopeptide repeat protein [Candidatus Hydrogenedentota bacterium]